MGILKFRKMIPENVRLDKMIEVVINIMRERSRKYEKMPDFMTMDMLSHWLILIEENGSCNIE